MSICHGETAVWDGATRVETTIQAVPQVWHTQRVRE